MKMLISQIIKQAHSNYQILLKQQIKIYKFPAVTTAYHQKDITSSKPSLTKGSTKPTFSLRLHSHNIGCTYQLLCESVLSTIAHSVQEEGGKLTKQQLNQNFLMGGQHLPHLTLLIFLLPIKDSTSKCFLSKTILLKFTNSLFSFNP